MQKEIVYALCAVGGIMFHTLSKYSSLREDARKANTSLSFGQFLKDDWVGVAMSAIPPFLWGLTYGEAAIKYKELATYTGISFIVVGALGSWGFQMWLSQTKKKLRDVIDVKSNVADNKEPNQTD